MLTRQYIANHSDNIHTMESFARAIVGLVLAQAEKDVGTGERERVQVEGSFTIEAFTSRNCVRVCYETKNGIVCLHVKG